MKSIYNKISGLLLMIMIFSCNDVLEKEPLGLISDAVVWEDEALADAYLNDVYARTEFINLRVNNQFTINMVAAMGGELRTIGGWQSPYKSATSVIDESGVDNHLDYWKYENIRNANYFIQQMEERSTLDEEFIRQRVAEARFLRAYMYFGMVKRFGGVPIITDPQTLDAPEEEIFVSRNSEKEVYDFIGAELDAIADILPAIQPDGISRPTKWAALAFKSRAMLYAASIGEFGDMQMNGLLGIPDGNVQDYAQQAYDAAKTVIEQSGHQLYNELDDKTTNFHNLHIDETETNQEKIMVQKFAEGLGFGTNFNNLAIPAGFATNWGSNFNVFYDLVELFEFQDGSPGTSISREELTSQEWAVDELFNNRDPRFKASVFYPETPFQGSKVYFHSSTIVDGEQVTDGFIEGDWPASGPTRNTNRTGFHQRKKIDEDHQLPLTKEDDTDHIIFRLGEVYLNLAEAALYLNLEGDALDAINALRERAGMPDKTSVDHDVVRHERQVELAFEDHRYWDLRRWRIAVEILDGVRLQGLRYDYNWETKKYQVTLVNGEGNARTFQDRHYYLPLGVGRTADNPNLDENPGYSTGG